jgi:lantibiotic modifying enzyme
MQLTREELKKICEKSSTLHERLKSDFIPDSSSQNESLIKTRIEQWCQVVAKGDWDQFEKRLAWDDLSSIKVRRFLGNGHMGEDWSLPNWTKTLNECLIYAKTVQVGKELGLEINRCLDPQIPLPFEEIPLPFIYWARNKLKSDVNSNYELLSNTAHANLERSLLNRLSSLCALSLELEFSVSRTTKHSNVVSFLKESTDKYTRQKDYKNFVKYLLEGGLSGFFQEYAVLARLMVTATEFWVDATRELISRLALDWSAIQNTFQPKTELGKVLNIQPDLSDLHHKGRSVVGITFASGLKLVYKPRNLGIDCAYINLLNWCNHQEIPLLFKLFQVLNRSTYGWVEFIEYSPCENQEQYRRYYWQFGALLGLVYLLDGTDFHVENIINHGEHPVLVDVETLMHPRPREAQEQAVFPEAQF